MVAQIFLKAIGYIERVVNSDFFVWKRPNLLNMCATCTELPFYISTRHTTVYKFRDHPSKKMAWARGGRGGSKGGLGHFVHCSGSMVLIS